MNTQDLQDLIKTFPKKVLNTNPDNNSGCATSKTFKTFSLPPCKGFDFSCAIKGGGKRSLGVEGLELPVLARGSVVEARR
jgi:hypothetical protein